MELTATLEFERFLITGLQARCPQDQMRFFLGMGYVPTPRQLEFHAAARAADLPDGPEEIAFGGARGPGKSHSSMIQGADDCTRRPGLKGLFLRKIAKNAKESFEDLIRRAYFGLPHEYVPSRSMVVFPNGSRILFGGFRTEQDIESYVGIEYDFIIIEEANQVTAKKQEMIRGSLRTSRDDWRPRLYLTFNPGGVGHQHIRTRYLLPFRAGSEKENRTRFIFTNYRDNPFLNPEYVRWLENLQGPLGKAWRDGDMDSFEGQAFAAFDYARHVIDPQEIPAHWARFRGLDWGSSSPMCVLWGARNPDNGRWIVYRELYINPEEGDQPLTDRQQAVRIGEMTEESEKITNTYADPSIWEKKALYDSDESTARVYTTNKVNPLTPANNDRLGGKRRIDRLLADLPDGRPGLLIFRNCRNLIRTMPLLSFDEVRVEDVNTDMEDHAYDALRYLTTPSKEKNGEQRQARKPSPFASSQFGAR